MKRKICGNKNDGGISCLAWYQRETDIEFLPVKIQRADGRETRTRARVQWSSRLLYSCRMTGNDNKAPLAKIFFVRDSAWRGTSPFDLLCFHVHTAISQHKYVSLRVANCVWEIQAWTKHHRRFLTCDNRPAWRLRLLRRTHLADVNANWRLIKVVNSQTKDRRVTTYTYVHTRAHPTSKFEEITNLSFYWIKRVIADWVKHTESGVFVTIQFAAM